MVDNDPKLLALTADIVGAYIGGSPLPAAQVPDVIQSVYRSLQGLAAPVAIAEPVAELAPAVPIRKSVTPDFLISLESGKKFKTLKRYLMANYGMTPEDYRRKWGLPADYPMTAANYATRRSELAKSSGLGRKSIPEDQPPEAAAPARRDRKNVAA